MIRLLGAGLAIVSLALVPFAHALSRAEVSLGERADVDLELVLAVDTSNSMDRRELQLQRDGYVQALVEPKFLKAIDAGEKGRIAVLYMEWAGPAHQIVVIPWTVIDDAKDAARLADELAAQPLMQPVQSSAGTSISQALRFAMNRFYGGAQQAPRRVIDISGNGANNAGGPVVSARDAVVASGITINGLPIVRMTDTTARVATPNTEPPFAAYYENCVIGGPDAFLVVAEDLAKFGEAIRRKLTREILAATSPPKIVRISARSWTTYDCAAPGERAGR
jgi:hypothetical protein